MARQLALLQTERFGRYRLLAELGGGGMARVFLANFDGPGGFVKPCVVKKVRPEYLHDAEFRTAFIPGFPPKFERVLARALTARRDDRYASAEELRAALEAWRAEERLGPATQELSALLAGLFPDGMPTKPPVRPLTALPGTAAPAPEPEEIALDEFELLEPAPSGHWREIAVAGAVGLVATAAFWLFVLP